MLETQASRSVPGQSVGLRQPTHVFVSVRHTGVPPEHVALSTHATHVFVSTLQARAPATVQFALLVHGTHVFVSKSQAGVGPLQAVLFSAVHCTQLVPPRHAGVAPGQRLQMPPSLPASGMT